MDGNNIQLTVVDNTGVVLTGTEKPDPEIINQFFLDALSDGNLEGDIPKDGQVELKLIAELLINPEHLDHDDISLKLEPEIFYYEAHQHIYRALLRIKGRREQVSLLSVEAELNKSNLLSSIGGRNKLAALFSTHLPTATPVEMTDHLRELYFKRKFIQIGRQLILGAKDPRQDASTIISNTQKSVSLLAKAFSCTNDTQAVYIDNAFEDLIEELANGGRDTVSTGYIDIDQRTNGGFEPGDLVFVCGRPSMGKRQILCDLSYLHWSNIGRPVLYFTFEMSIKQLSRRILARKIAGIHGISPLDSDKLYNRKLALSATDWQLITTAFDNSKGARLRLVHCAPVISQITYWIEQAKAENNDLGMVVIDYIQLMRGENQRRSSTKAEELSDIARSLKELALKHDIVIVVAAQISRNVEKQGDKRPTMGDIKEFGGAEEAADQVWLAFRPDYYDNYTQQGGLIELNLAKLRNSGETGTVTLRFDPKNSRLLCIHGANQSNQYQP